MSYRTWGEHKETVPTIWGADWDYMRHSQLLSHKGISPTFVKYVAATLWIWGVDHNKMLPVSS